MGKRKKRVKGFGQTKTGFKLGTQKFEESEKPKKPFGGRRKKPKKKSK